jgi:hypothetical protein
MTDRPAGGTSGLRVVTPEIVALALSGVVVVIGAIALSAMSTGGGLAVGRDPAASASPAASQASATAAPAVAPEAIRAIIDLNTPIMAQGAAITKIARVRDPNGSAIASELRKLNQLLNAARSYVGQPAVASLVPAIVDELRRTYDAALERSDLTLAFSVSAADRYRVGALEVVALLEPIEGVSLELAALAGVPSPVPSLSPGASSPAP